MPKILVVEDEVDLCNLIKSHLETEGHTVAQAFDGPSALALVESQKPDLIVLDWMLPGLDGLSVCRQVRTHHLMPILMLTARDEEVDRVLGLEVGADDYVVKPFSIRELMARVRATLRRVALDSQAPPAQGGGNTTVLPVGAPGPTLAASLVHGPLRIDPNTHLATLAGQDLDLTPKEFELALLFASHPGRAFSRDFLLERLWGSEYDGFDRVVDTHIARLRK